MPDLVLACLTGGQTRLAGLAGPAILNLWASTCGPCQTELPALQAYHAEAGAFVAVIGVATADRRMGTDATVADRALTFPMLWDPRGALLRAVGRTGLPVTLFVGANGRIAYLYNGPTLDLATIRRLSLTYLGVGARP